MKTVSTKKTLLASVFAMLLCVSMFVGSTFAWFTSSATTNVNTIQAGNLKVELLGADDETPLGDSLKWVAKDGRDQDKIYWEPGCSYNLEGFRIKNAGNLALKYKVVISGLTGSTKLLEVIDFTVKMGDDTVALEGWEGSLAANDVTEVITITGTMRADAGNDYMNEEIKNISITVVATQAAYESDSNGSDYDEDAEYPIVARATVETETNEAGDTVTKNEVVLKSAATTDPAEGDVKPLASATVPAATKVEEGVSELKLEVKSAFEPDGFTVGTESQAVTYEIKVSGIAADNTEKVEIELYVGKGLLNPVMYHNGVEMAAEDYAYDETTGIMTIRTATFSPFTVVSDKAAALVDGTPYESIEAAIAGATDGATVTLAKDYEGNVIINGKNIVLDFDGNTVKGILYIGCINDGFTSAKDPSTVVLKDSTGKGGVTASASFAIIAKNGSKITVESGNYVNEYAKEGGGYSDVIKMTNCELIVNGGYLHNNAQVGNYNRVIDVDNGAKAAKVVINGGKLEGTQKCGLNGWYGSYSYLIASNGSDDKFDVEINGGEFISHTGYGWLTQVYGNVVVNDCTFVSEGHNQVFDIKTNNYTTAIEGVSVTVRGGTYTITEGKNAHLAGFAYCNKSLANAYGYAKGSLILDPVKEIKINTTTHAKTLEDCGVTQSEKGADGFYTITK